MAGIIYRGLLGNSAGGGGSGGCGVVLSTIYDDNFDCGSSIDTAGTRFSGASPWTTFGGNLVSEAIVSDEWRVETSTNGSGYNPCGAYQSAPAGDWTFETSCYMTKNGAGAAYYEGIGLYLAESATGSTLMLDAGQKSVGGVWTYVVRVRNTGGGSLFEASVATWGANYDAAFRISRASATLTYDYSLDNGANWTTLGSHAQTVPFTTAPDRVGVAKANAVPNIGNTYGYFRYFYKTA